jgi:outer membrane protein assembly factor BamD (BamD/ComL family)
MRALVAAALVALCAPPAVAKKPAAVDDPEKLEAMAAAGRHYQLGMDAFNRQDLDAAAREFEAGYAAVPDASFQYNLGKVHMAGKHTDEAVAAFQKYLELSPSAPNAAEVRGYLNQLRPQARPRVDLVAKRAPATTEQPGSHRTLVIVVVAAAVVLAALAGATVGILYATRPSEPYSLVDARLP